MSKSNIMHYSGAKQGWEKMMAGGPDRDDFVFEGDVNDQFDHSGFAKAQAMRSAKMASGEWMMDTVNIGHIVDPKKDPVYRHPHLAKLAKQGYTFNDIQSAGNQLGITSFNSENDGKAISEFLENHYNPSQPEKKKKPKEKVKPEKPAELSQTAKDAIAGGTNRPSAFGTEEDEVSQQANMNLGSMSYDPTAGIKNQDVGNFLDDYKLKLKRRNRDGGVVTRGKGERTSAILGSAAGSLN